MSPSGGGTQAPASRPYRFPPSFAGQHGQARSGPAQVRLATGPERKGNPAEEHPAEPPPHDGPRGAAAVRERSSTRPRRARTTLVAPQTAREDADPPTANHPSRSSHHVLPPGADRARPATA